MIYNEEPQHCVQIWHEYYELPCTKLLCYGCWYGWKDDEWMMDEGRSLYRWSHILLSLIYSYLLLASADKGEQYTITMIVTKEKAREGKG